MQMRATAVAKVLTALFTGLWWWVAFALGVLVVLFGLVLARGLQVGVQIGPNGEPNFVAGGAAQMVLPVAFELDPGAARVTSIGERYSGVVEETSGRLRVGMPDRAWIPMSAVGVMLGFVLWILAELAALCRSVRDGQPFAPGNALRIRRLAFAVVLAEVSRAGLVYAAQAYVAARFAGDHLRFTAWPHTNTSVFVCALILFVLSEVFRAGTQLDEEQSLTV